MLLTPYIEFFSGQVLIYFLLHATLDATNLSKARLKVIVIGSTRATRVKFPCWTKLFLSHVQMASHIIHLQTKISQAMYTCRHVPDLPVLAGNANQKKQKELKQWAPYRLTISQSSTRLG